MRFSGKKIVYSEKWIPSSYTSNQMLYTFPSLVWRSANSHNWPRNWVIDLGATSIILYSWFICEQSDTFKLVNYMVFFEFILEAIVTRPFIPAKNQLKKGKEEISQNNIDNCVHETYSSRFISYCVHKTYYSEFILYGLHGIFEQLNLCCSC